MTMMSKSVMRRLAVTRAEEPLPSSTLEEVCRQAVPAPMTTASALLFLSKDNSNFDGLQRLGDLLRARSVLAKAEALKCVSSKHISAVKTYANLFNLWVLKQTHWTLEERESCLALSKEN